jgi:serine/threonine protein phosphatase PrpC
MGRRAASVTGGNINYVAVVLTDDHKPDRPDEKARIQSCGGQVGSRQTLLDLTGRSNSTVAAGPCRVWYRKGTDTLGLAMSRSLGDGIVHTCGVSAEPEISEFRLDPQGRDEFVILATDGVWDVIDSAQAVRIVGGLITKAGINEWSALEASQHLCLLARRRWEALSLMIDDITCAVVKLPLLHERPAQ